MTGAALSAKRKAKADKRRGVARSHQRAKWHGDACRSLTCRHAHLPSIEAPEESPVFLSTPRARPPHESPRPGAIARAWAWMRGRGRG